MKILWVSHTNTLFGAERCLLEFIEATSGEHENYMVFPGDGKIIELASPYIKGHEVIPTDWWASPARPTLKRYLIKYYYIIRSIFLLKRYIKQVGADVVISNSFVIAHGAFAAKLAGKPHLYYIHEYVEEDHKYSFDLGRWFSCKLANILTDVFLVNAIGVKRKFEQFLPKEKIKLLYYIINVRKPVVDISNKAKLELLLPGRVEENKGQMDAIQAMKVLSQKGLDIHLTLIGLNDNHYSQRIRAFVKEENLSSSITLMDFCEDPFVFYVKADICISTSKMEAFGRTTIEAMKLGRPVIGTTGGETPFLVSEGKTGFLYNFGDYRGLADRIEYCYTRPVEINILKQNAEKYAHDNFGPEHFNKGLNEILNSLHK